MWLQLVKINCQAMNCHGVVCACATQLDMVRNALATISVHQMQWFKVHFSHTDDTHIIK